MSPAADDVRRHANKFYGKYSGEVADNADPRKQGRVMVTVPSVFGTDAAVRARPCFPYGHFFVPPVGAKVWVEFEAGELGYPIWVGGWYPQPEVPQEAQADPPHNRVIQMPSGHTIQINDEAGKEKIVIRHAGDSFVAIDEHGTVLVANANGSYLQLDSEGQKAVLVDETGNRLTMGADGAALVNNQGAMINVAGDQVHVRGGSVIVEGAAVTLGSNAADPTIMGNAFKILWALVQSHVHPTAMGPSGPSPMLIPPATDLLPGIHLTSAVMVR